MRGLVIVLGLLFTLNFAQASADCEAALHGRIAPTLGERLKADGRKMIEAYLLLPLSEEGFAASREMVGQGMKLAFDRRYEHQDLKVFFVKVRARIGTLRNFLNSDSSPVLWAGLQNSRAIAERALERIPFEKQVDEFEEGDGIDMELVDEEDNGEWLPQELVYLEVRAPLASPDMTGEQLVEIFSGTGLEIDFDHPAVPVSFAEEAEHFSIVVRVHADEAALEKLREKHGDKVVRVPGSGEDPFDFLESE